MGIRTEISHGAITIEIARPEKKNALTQQMYQAMADALQMASSDAAVHAVLIIGQPQVFTAGNDLEDFLRHPPAHSDAPVFAFMRAMLACDKPIIAAVNGAAIGIGTTMLLHCDLVYLGERATLSMPFVNLGLVPEFAASLLLPQHLGRVKAAEKLLLCEHITAEEALAYGLANAVLPPDEVVPHARRIAERFTHLSPGAVRDTRRLLRAADRETMHRVMQDEIATFAQRLSNDEAKEALTAFLEKRRPDFHR